jgi:hypothetical protein
MTVDHLAIASNQTGNFEAKLSDRSAHAINGGIVLSGIAGILDQSFGWPKLDVLRRRMRDHTRTFQ